jgi:hypothetical protein
MNRWFLAAVVAAMVAGWVVVDNGAASRPVQRTLSGCVLEGIFYSVNEGSSPAGRAAPVVYRITVHDMDLGPCEGKRIRVQGRLLPGDRFMPDRSSLRVLGPCDGDSRKAIRDGGF